MSAETVTPTANPPAPRRLRTLLIFVIPALAAAGLGWMWLNGGRWISTDNAYVGAQKVLITPEVSGRVVSIAVAEGQKVNPGDVLLAVDPEPYRIALAEAEAKRSMAAAEHGTLLASLASLARQIDLATNTLALRRGEAERKATLAASHAGSQQDVDAARIAVSAAQSALEQLSQARTTALAQLMGDPALPLSRFPAHAAAEGAVAKASRDLAETTIRAPLAGIATQVSSIQMGRYVSAGDAIFAIVGTEHVWVDANPKETDLTHVQAGQPVIVTVDAFPDRTFKAHVAAISPGTGSQFSIIPAQNASGNWVKVVQRVPVRIEFEPSEAYAGLRSGMSASVAIDTGHIRSLHDLLGAHAAAAPVGTSR